MSLRRSGTRRNRDRPRAQNVAGPAIRSSSGAGLQTAVKGVDGRRLLPSPCPIFEPCLYETAGTTRLHQARSNANTAVPAYFLADLPTGTVVDGCTRGLSVVCRKRTNRSPFCRTYSRETVHAPSALPSKLLKESLHEASVDPPGRRDKAPASTARTASATVWDERVSTTEIARRRGRSLYNAYRL